VGKIQPVYPGYIFMYLDLDARIRDMISTPIKARFIRFGQTISVVPAEVITEIKRLESLQLLVREAHKESPFQPGRRVRISLPVADINAIILYLMNKNRAMVETPLGKVTVPIHKMTLLG
jgi:transcription antitermination factor NusG